MLEQILTLELGNDKGFRSLNNLIKLADEVILIGFLLDYEYILMEDPFAAIDFITGEVVTDFLKELKEEAKTIVVPTHQLDIAQELADETLFLNNGQVHQINNQFKTPNELKKYIRAYT